MSPSQCQVSDQSHCSHVRLNADGRVLAVLAFFEHFITIDREIDLFWKHKFSGAAVLFFTNRYLISVESALFLVHLFDTSLAGSEVGLTDSCASNYMWSDIFAPQEV